MTNEPIKAHAFPTRPKPNRAKSQAKTRSKVVDFLIATGFWPLVLIGNGINSFGWGTVAAFMLGGLSVYGYALAGGRLPPVKSDHPKMVRLSGVVRDGKRQPITEPFSVGVLANQQGPLQDAEGSFTLEVPESTSYDVALWTTSEDVKFYRGIPAVQDDKGLKLQRPLPFLGPVSTAELYVPPPTPQRPEIDAVRAYVGK